MRLYFATIPVFGGAEAAEELNRFLAGHRVVSVERELVQDGGASAWAVCVVYLDGESAAVPTRRGRVDYREVLPEEEFAVFARLRALRKTLADRDGVPAYALFTNEQLVTMVRQRVSSPADLSAIAGVGPARVEKYGREFLEILREWSGAQERGHAKAQSSDAG